MNTGIYKIYQYLKNRKNKLPVSPNRISIFLQESQYWSTNRIKEFQIIQLNNLLHEAKESSEFYNKLYSTIELPLESIDEFTAKIPFIKKGDVINNSGKLKISPNRYSIRHTTSGSSGKPMVVDIAGMAEVYRVAGRMRFESWWGVKENDKSVLIWGFKNTQIRAETLTSKIKEYLRNRYDINVFSLNQHSIKKYFFDIEKFKPAYIRGYKSALLQFAELLESEGLKFKKFKFKVAIVTSEVLLEEERKYIETILGCKVANEYGSAEAGLFAYECPHGSMHIFEEAVYINTDKQNEVYVTELFNNSMPLIQYKNDDKIILSKTSCSCGRTSRVIDSIEGRVNDYIVRPDGTNISQYLFYYIVKELDDVGLENSILKYKVIQKKNSFSFYIVPGDKFSKKVIDYISNRMHKEIGENISISFTKVESIQRENSGKLRFFIREN